MFLTREERNRLNNNCYVYGNEPEPQSMPKQTKTRTQQPQNNYMGDGLDDKIAMLLEPIKKTNTQKQYERKSRNNQVNLKGGLIVI